MEHVPFYMIEQIGRVIEHPQQKASGCCNLEMVKFSSSKPRAEVLMDHLAAVVKSSVIDAEHEEPSIPAEV
jgi:hypothetical protein